MKSKIPEKLNQKASAPENKPDKIIETVNPQPGQTIADIGAGGGYFAIRFAEAVGENGRVYAVDTDPEMLNYAKNIACQKGLKNIDFVPAKEGPPDLPVESVDTIFMRNVTHHIPDRVNYFKKLKKFLKPTGKVFIIEYKKGKLLSFQRFFKHYIPKETIVTEMTLAGYTLIAEYDFLPKQHFTAYKK